MPTGKKKSGKITVEVQYFYGCPNSQEMMRRVQEAIKRTNISIDYHEILVDTPEKAELYKFRGSPTVLINGSDLEGMPVPSAGNLACRYYSNGIPSIDTITDIIQDILEHEG